MILMIDNYDSFTYNIVQYFMELGEEVVVYRNDEITAEEAAKLDFTHLVISPGPGRPKDTGISIELIKMVMGKKPILGVCLGHQTIGELFGGEIVSAGKIMHGKADTVRHDGKGVFSGIINPVKIIRYHSLVIDPETIPDCLEVTAKSSDGEIMGIRHKKYDIEGVQFHPESIGSEEGLKMLSNFIEGDRDMFSIGDILKKVVGGEDLTKEEAREFMSKVTDGDVTPAQIGSFLTALTIKGVTVDELTGFAGFLKSKATVVPLTSDKDLLDTCGTGGDGSGTFNISTTCAFVAAGAGAVIAKHGNRSITSKSGSADVLEELGVKIDMTPDQAGNAIDKAGMAFLFAPGYHPAFKNIMGPRKELGFRTVFNIMGPLLNPAGVSAQVIGVFAEEYTELMAQVLKNLGLKKALVVHGRDGLDEFTLTDTTKVTELNDGWIKTWEFDPVEYGFSLCDKSDLKGGNATENAGIIKAVLEGEEGPKRDIVVINSAAAIYSYGISNDFKEAIELAKKSIDSGAAKKALDSLVAISKEA